MTINLKKGQRISLAKEAPGLTRLMCGLGWDVAQRSGGLLSFLSNSSDFDLDASVLCLNATDKLKNNGDVIYFSNLRHRSNAITHLGDNLTGEGEGDDEQIVVDLPQIPPGISKLVFVVNIYNCTSRKQDFGQVNNAFVRLVDLANNREIARYNLSGQEYSGKTGMIMAEIYRHNGDWKMAALGNGIQVNGLEELVRSYS
ncbi:TerD family protein [Lusitaniella coriacea LEGE 07157]|uniref:TerD family protein n=1 Tax=Lusitaniella coriacea LEGE 07157 TaxID=945747 RepID=A0A8J7JDD7_9CYAN|nr:TerD family protein [Lusitaniella coriacea]MBE9118210.1 TerD family protein [Lusitaniella coriacea LEGE 07157]